MYGLRREHGFGVFSIQYWPEEPVVKTSRALVADPATLILQVVSEVWSCAENVKFKMMNTFLISENEAEFIIQEFISKNELYGLDNGENKICGHVEFKQWSPLLFRLTPSKMSDEDCLKKYGSMTPRPRPVR